jgi:hypothetical protein
VRLDALGCVGLLERGGVVSLHVRVPGGFRGEGHRLLGG